MSKPVDPKRIFREAGAVIQGHFLLTSGLHSPVYWEKFRVLERPGCTEPLCRLIADCFRGEDVELVAGPTTGGIIIAYEVARQLGRRSVFAERDGSIRTFRRGFKIAAGERVLIVDDILTTGGSVREVIAEVRRRGGKPIGVGVLVDRSEGALDFDLPLYSCLKTSVPAFRPEECPLCRKGIPLTKPGSG